MAKDSIEHIREELKQQKPWHFKGEGVENVDTGNVRVNITSRAVALFLLVDIVIVAGILMYFVLRDGGDNMWSGVESPVALPKPLGTHKTGIKITLPDAVDESVFSVALTQDETFRNLYRQKINDPDYIRRKSTSESRRYDDSLLEQKIKSARSLMALERLVPIDGSVNRLPHTTRPPVVDGILEDTEWGDAAHFLLDELSGSRLYFKSDENWLFIAADVPAEITSDGYDQLRVYFHSGLAKKLVNERIHIGRGTGITSIRQTTFRWHGPPPLGDNERWKKYKISDWGVYQYAFGASSMTIGHRQYEAAIHLGESALHRGVPFTLYAEIETDPLKNEQGKFVGRQFLGQLGSAENPLWFSY